MLPIWEGTTNVLSLDAKLSKYIRTDPYHDGNHRIRSRATYKSKRRSVKRSGIPRKFSAERKQTWSRCCNGETAYKETSNGHQLLLAQERSTDQSGLAVSTESTLLDLRHFTWTRPLQDFTSFIQSSLISNTSPAEYDLLFIVLSPDHYIIIDNASTPQVAVLCTFSVQP